MDGPQRPKLVESSADHPGIRRIICLMTLKILIIITLYNTLYYILLLLCLYCEYSM